MFLQALALILIASAAYGCECEEPSVRAKIKESELIFRGKIVALRSVAQEKTVVFQVSRVWKGDLGQTFEVPALEETSMCRGFWPYFLKVGNDLLVYARRLGNGPEGPVYVTSICGFHKPAEGAADFKVLGTGRAPHSPR